MATIRKLRGKWQVLIRRKFNKPFYKTFSLKEDAKTWARKTELHIEQGTFKDNALANRYTLKEIIHQYRDKITPTKKGKIEETYKINKLARDPIAEKKLSDLTPLVVLSFRDELAKTLKPSSVNNYLNLISVSLKYAEDFLGVDLIHKPMLKVKRLREANFSGRVISYEEEQRLLYWSRKSKAYWLTVAIILGIDCGLRRGEILKLKFSDINFGKHTAKLKDTKNSTDREIGLSTRVVNELKKLPRSLDDRIIPIYKINTFRFYFHQARNRAKVNKRFHDTRHTFASRMTEKGWSITELAQQGGWKQLQVLKRYTHINAKVLARKLG